MSVDFTLSADVRTDQGKGASRRLRREKLVPAIVYGHGTEPTTIQLAENEVMRNLKEEAFYSHVLQLSVGGAAAESVILKALQRHPYKNKILHMDFQRVRADEAIHVHVPLHFLNESTSAGVKAGGKVSHAEVEIHVSCLPKDLPEFIEVDVENLGVGETIHISELSLPEGVSSIELSHGDDRAVVTISNKPGVSSSDDEGDAE